jgi:hypothetical protein
MRVSFGTWHERERKWREWGGYDYLYSVLVQRRVYWRGHWTPLVRARKGEK